MTAFEVVQTMLAFARKRKEDNKVYLIVLFYFTNAMHSQNQFLQNNMKIHPCTDMELALMPL